MREFTEPPEIGYIMMYGRKPKPVRLIEVEPYVRKDGTDSFILVWECQYGRIGITGLKFKNIKWQKTWEIET